MKEIKKERGVYKRSQLYEVWLRMRKSKQTMFDLGLFICTLLIVILADVLMDYNTDVIRQDIANRLQPSNATHWLGTDQYERGVLVCLIYGARTSLIIGAITVFALLIIGGLVGAIAGFYGGKLDNVSVRIIDIFLSLLSILLAIAMITVPGTGIVSTMVTVTISRVPWYARIIHSSILSIRDEGFIEATRAIGAWDGHIILEDIIPNAIGPVIVQATLRVGEIIILVVGSGFLELGINPPIPEWGAMPSEGREFIRNLPYLVVFPGTCIVFTVLSLSLLGDGLRDASDP